MWSLSLDWIVLAVLAVLVFWAVGAYNRVMRLRSACVQAFGAFDSYFQQTQGLLNECHAAQVWPAEPDGRVNEDWQQSSAAMASALAQARARPLSAQAMQLLESAHDAQFAAWQALKNRSGAAEDSAWWLRWQQQAQTGLVADQFNHAVAQYNAAIAQFPARVLAWFFGFRAARPLQPALVPQLPGNAA